jgi:hypothetical protein
LPAHRLGAPFPTPRAPMPSRTAPGLARGPLVRLDRAPVDVAGWGELPSSVVALATVPDWGHARDDETVTAGCLRNYPVVPTLDHHGIVALPPTCVFVRRSGRQDEHLAERPPDRSFSHPATAAPQRATRGTPPRVPVGNREARAGPGVVQLRPTNTRRSRESRQPRQPAHTRTSGTLVR